METLREKWACQDSGFVQEQLGLNTIYPGDCCRVSMTWVISFSSTACGSCRRPPSATKRSPITPLLLSVDEEGIACDPAPLQGGISGQDFGVHVAQDHGCRAAVVQESKFDQTWISSSRRGRKSEEEKCLRSRISTQSFP